MFRQNDNVCNGPTGFRGTPPTRALAAATNPSCGNRRLIRYYATLTGGNVVGCGDAEDENPGDAINTTAVAFKFQLVSVKTTARNSRNVLIFRVQSDTFPNAEIYYQFKTQEIPNNCV